MRPKKEFETAELERLLKRKLIESCRVSSKQFDYYPSDFIGMLDDKGTVDTARLLILSKRLPYGFVKLLENNGLELTVEHIVLIGPWKTLFSPQILDAARKRLREFGFAYKEWFDEDSR